MDNQNGQLATPKIGKVKWGDLRRLSPLSRVFGQDRGTTIRRYYIDKFITAHSNFIYGNVLEVGDNNYTKNFGQPGVVVDVLLPSTNGQKGTVVGNLISGEGIKNNYYDAVILTQVLHVLPDMGVALKCVFDALVSGGVLLATLPTITQISRYDMDRWGDYWRVTDKAVQLLAERNIPSCNTTVTAYGNHLTAIAALTGLAAEELKKNELEYFDPEYQILIGMCSQK